jgi:hypothetical protein
MVVIINPSFLTPVWVAYCPAPKLTSNPRASSFSLYQPPADSISWHLQSLPQASSWGGPSFLAHPL